MSLSRGLQSRDVTRNAGITSRSDFMTAGAPATGGSGVKTRVVVGRAEVVEGRGLQVVGAAQRGGFGSKSKVRPSHE